MELKEIVEALIFASPEPITAKAVARCILNKVDDDRKALEDAAEEGEEPAQLELDESILNVTPEGVEALVEELNAEYEETGRTFRLIDGPSGWRFFTMTDYAEWVRELFPGQKPARLSAPALETLAIIAYRQPITKADIEAVRGVSVDGVLQKIIDRGLIRIAGRADQPGRPLLYGTSELFMEHFGVKEIDELPNASELRTMPLPDSEGNEQNPNETQKQLDQAEEQKKEDEEAARKELSGEGEGDADQKEQSESSGPSEQSEEAGEPAAAEGAAEDPAPEDDEDAVDDEATDEEE
ncbi:MAG: SMC-Scp complex subunit ScpB [Verrucomicrobiota bacterium]